MRVLHEKKNTFLHVLHFMPCHNLLIVMCDQKDGTLNIYRSRYKSPQGKVRVL